MVKLIYVKFQHEKLVQDLIEQVKSDYWATVSIKA